MTWQKMKIGSFLKRRKDAVEIKDNIEYKRITIKTKHQGVYLRDNLKGSLIGTKLQFTVNVGQFLLSKIDARLGAFGIVPEELNGAMITGNFWAFDVDKEKVNIDWFNLFTSSGNFYEICNQASSGTTHRKYLDETKFLNFEIEIPNPDEQALFIQKYKSYYGIYNKLNVEIDKQQSYLQLLRQSILQEAVQGKLVPQDANDEPAEQLIQRIKAEKAQLIKKGKLKKEKELPPVTEEEIPFALPEGWVWCRLDDVCLKITDGEHLNPPITEKGVPLLSAKHIGNYSLIWEDFKYVSREFATQSRKRCDPEKNDLLIVGRGGGVGRTIICNIDEEFCLMGSVILLKLSAFIEQKYIYYYLNSTEGNNKLKTSSSATAQPAIYLTHIKRNYLVPIPPQTLQKQIIVKVEKLLQSINQLENQAQQNKSQAEHLLQAVLKEAFTVTEELKALAKPLKKYKENEELTMAAEE